jgi:uncharacterized protein YkwD
MRSTLVLLSVLFTLASAKATEPLLADLNPANYTPNVTYFDTGSGQHFYYDAAANTFFVYEKGQAPTETQSAPAQQPIQGDPTGLLQTVNYYRSQRGLHPWAFDGNLYNSAINNNAWQRLRGMGHHDVPSAQNSAWGQLDVASVLNMWAASPGHAATLFGGYSFAAIAYDGLYWTLNAR